MFGLLFLIGVPLSIYFYYKLVRLVARNTPWYLSLLIYVGATAIPFTAPAWYKYSTEYENFNKLCESPERVKYYKSAAVPVFYTEYFDDGLAALSKYRYESFVHNDKAYVRSSVFSSDACLSCRERSHLPCDSKVCVITVAPPDASNYVVWKFLHGGSEISSKTRQSLTQVYSDQFGVLAEKSDYTFYQYGKGWAVILGGASGSAPSLSCKTNTQFDFQFITPSSRN